MSIELDYLKNKVDRQQAAYDACDSSTLRGYRRTLAEAWLPEVGLLLERLQRDVVELSVEKPPAVGMRQAWNRYYQVFSALGPICAAVPLNATPAERATGANRALLSVANRLRMVMAFLGLQIVVAIALIAYMLSLFSTFNPQTALTGEQLDARKLVQTHVQRIEGIVDREARIAAQQQPAPAATGAAAPTNSSPAAPHDNPNVAAVRGEIEGLAASLEELRLSARDRQAIGLWLQSALTSLDTDPPDFANAKGSLSGLAALLAVNEDTAAPSLFTLTMLGSLLGMITMTIHMNWKWRNRWDTVGFLPWYITKLIGAPVLSIAAMGFMSQLTFTKSLNESTGFSDLGLRGADPLLIFSIAILTGLFSNRVFDWLREIAQGVIAAKPGGAPPQTETAAADNNPTPEN